MKLWITTATTPHGNDYGLVTVVAETREDAIAKARAKLEAALATEAYVPRQRYAKALLDNLGSMSELADDVLIDWEAAGR